MFLQVGLCEEDQRSLRFLWPPSVVFHQYTRQISGARDSQACAIFAPQKTATDHKAEYPKTASAVVQKFYIDDYLAFFQRHGLK